MCSRSILNLICEKNIEILNICRYTSNPHSNFLVILSKSQKCIDSAHTGGYDFTCWYSGSFSALAALILLILL